MITIGKHARVEPSPLVALLHPRGQGAALTLALLAGAVWGTLATWRLGLPAWVGPALALALLAPPLALKWRADYMRLGAPAMVLSVLLVAQGLHSVEHLAQWVQFHALGWPAKAAGGLISPLNSEVVHFTWNTAVLSLVVYLIAAGMRGRWMWLLLLWAGAHSAEHVYLFGRFVAATWELRTAGLPLDGAQGLPGLLGRGGWLAAQAASSPAAGFLCKLAPGLAEAPRLDVHFGWNAGELALLLAAAHTARLPGPPRA
ncbi:MAG TPA: hypothetical protein PKD53_27410 [Chloroflexaceae bacterium]|nr:hypothetical protein [Chloroflexaceae bacterium]